MCSIISKVLLVMALIMLLPLFTSAQYYYAGNVKTDLKLDTTKCLIRLSNSVEPSLYDSILTGIPGILNIVVNSYTLDAFVACSLSTQTDYLDYLWFLRSHDFIQLIAPYYTQSDSSDFVIGSTFCCMFKPNVTPYTIDSINSAFRVIVCDSNQYCPNSYLFGITDSSPGNALEIANFYYESGLTIYALPQLRISIILDNYKVYNYLSSTQYNLRKIIGHWDSATAWDITDGDSNLIVALLDDGFNSHIEVIHERILAGYDFADLDADPTPPDTLAHGMACAGLIAASNICDSSMSTWQLGGIASVAPRIKILPIKILSSVPPFFFLCSNYYLAKAFDYARDSGASVISCSWHMMKGATTPVDTAASRAFQFGRGGKGCVISCASGSSGGTVGFPAAWPFCLAVGAIDSNDVVYDYSAGGVNLDIVAPSGYRNLWSLDQMGALGVNPQQDNCGDQGAMLGGWQCHFDGTSAACPLVSGTAALLISRRPDLTSAQIYDIIRNSAQKNLKWGMVVPPDPDYGYGRVDAFRALLAVSRGDPNNSKLINIQDIGYIIKYLYYGGPPPTPDLLMGDPDCNGAVNLADVTFLINFIYQNGPPPPLCYEY